MRWRKILEITRDNNKRIIGERSVRSCGSPTLGGATGALYRSSMIKNELNRLIYFSRLFLFDNNIFMLSEKLIGDIYFSVTTS